MATNTLVHDASGDWVGLYVDGVLKLEGHSLEPWQLIELFTGRRPGSISVDLMARDMTSLPHYLDQIHDLQTCGCPGCDYCDDPSVDDTDKLGANSTVDDRERRLDLRCSHCPPHGGENKTHSKRGVRKRKGKNKRR